MNQAKAISVPMDTDGEIDLENAKQVMVGVVRHLCENPFFIMLSIGSGTLWFLASRRH